MAELEMSADQPVGTGEANDLGTVAARIRRLLGQGRLRDARELVGRALADDPTCPELRCLRQTISPGRVELRPDSYPNRVAELEWVARNRTRFQGKWVALVGDRAVAVADVPEALLGKLKQQQLSATPLVLHLA